MHTFHKCVNPYVLKVGTRNQSSYNFPEKWRQRAELSISSLPLEGFKFLYIEILKL